jgi:hypothetical protein
MTQPASILERVGVSYLRKRSDAARAVVSRPPADDAVLSAAEQGSLRAVERGTIVRATFAGALFGTIAGSGEIVARRVLGIEPEAGRALAFWAVVGAFAVVASGLEILYLYWAGLRSVHRLAQVARIELFPHGAREERVAVASALARAALELPNPRAQLFGIDPMREASKLRIVLGTLAYKAKIGITNFVAKAILRRILVRALLRAWLPMVAVPVVAAWNGIISWRVMREARIRAIGPSAARELVDAALGEATGAHENLPARVQLAVFRAVGSTVVQKRDMHPNVVALLHELVARLGDPPDERLDDADAFVASLPELAAEEQRIVLAVLVAAVVLDGRMNRAEARLLDRAHSACGKTADLGYVRGLAHAFVAGRPMQAALR